MIRLLLLAATLQWASSKWGFIGATTYDITAAYVGESCTSTPPYAVYARQNGGCEVGGCYGMEINEVASTTCGRDYLQSMISSSLAELGRACVSTDPWTRPSAAEALYQLQIAIAKEIA